MKITRLRWRTAAIALAISTAVVASAGMPTIAASSHLRVTAGHSHARASAIPVRCRKRNKASGTLKYSDWQFPDTLNPYQSAAAVSDETMASIHDYLVGYDNKSRLFPVLLERLPSLQNGEVRDGGRTVVAFLRKGLRWSDGSEITAADVKFGWQLEIDKNSLDQCSGTCDVISSINTIGKYEVIFHLSESYAAFLANGLPDVWPIQWKGAWKKGDFKTAAKKLVQDSAFNFEKPGFPTNGAYQVAQFVRDDRIVLHPMRYYSTLSCGAKVQTLIFAFYSSKPGMIAAAASHETDTTTNYTLADLPELRQHVISFNLATAPAYEVENLTFNVDPKYQGRTNPLHSLQVRQALALALDKSGLVESALGVARSQLGNVIAWSPLIITPALVQPFADKALRGQWDPIARKYTADTGHGKAVADAKTLLSRAGYGSGFTIDGFTTSGNPTRYSQFAIIQKNWSDIGVTFNPNFVPSDKLNAAYENGGILQRGDFQVAMFDDVGFPDPDSFKFEWQHQYIDREQKQHDLGNLNIAGVHDKSFDTAFNKAAASFDAKVRQRWYNVWQVGLNQKAYEIPLYYRPSINTADQLVGNFKANPAATNEWNTYEWFIRSRG